MSMLLRPRFKFWGSIVLSVVIFGSMVMAINETTPWDSEPAGLGSEDAQMDALVVGLFEEHVLALEVLGVLLTAAMIGAMVIARPLGQEADKSNYWSDPRISESRAMQAKAAEAAPSTLAPAMATAATHEEESQ